MLHVLPPLTTYVVADLSGTLWAPLQRKTRAAAQRQLLRLETQVKVPNYREDIARGIENAPRAFIGMLQGKNLGKQRVQVAEVERAHRTRRGTSCAVVFAVKKGRTRAGHEPFERSRP